MKGHGKKAIKGGNEKKKRLNQIKAGQTEK